MAKFQYQAQVIEALYQQQAGAFSLTQDEAELKGTIQEVEPGYYLLHTTHQQQASVFVVRDKEHYQVHYQGEVYSLEALRKQAAGTQGGPASNRIEAPLTGKILQVSVEPGQSVEAGDTLVIMESMKMETALVAPYTGSVDTVACQTGEQVAQGQLLVQMLAPESDTPA